MNAEKRKMEVFKKKESQVRFSFQTGRRCFNVFITLIDCCGVYPRARVRGACSWFSVPDEYPGAMTAEVIPGREFGAKTLVQKGMPFKDVPLDINLSKFVVKKGLEMAQEGAKKNISRGFSW